MKKLISSRKVKILRKVRRRIRRKRGRLSPIAVRGANMAARQSFFGLLKRLPDTKSEINRRGNFLSIVPPTVFSLSRNYAETLAFLMNFRLHFGSRPAALCEDGQRRKVYAEFGDITEIGAGAGLVLAAEVHHGAKLNPYGIDVHDNLWAENVHAYFTEAGLFELLRVNPKMIATRASDEELRHTLKFRSGRTSQGADAANLLVEIEKLVGRSVGTKSIVYDAISEALANVKHAYPEWFKSWPQRPASRWWTSAFWEPNTRRVGLQLYDRGAGIPATLPHQTHWAKVRRLVGLDKTDDALISAAMEYGRTSTGLAGRGKGLTDMARWVDKSGSGFLKILSGAGEVTYQPNGKSIRRKLEGSFPGTLVQWEVTVDVQ